MYMFGIESASRFMHIRVRAVTMATGCRSLALRIYYGMYGTGAKETPDAGYRNNTFNSQVIFSGSTGTLQINEI